MFMRLVQLKADMSNLGRLKQFYEKVTIKELQDMPGCLFAGLIQSNPRSDEMLSMTLWENQQRAEHYDTSGTYKRLLELTKPFLAESTEWRVQLSDSLELEYSPVTEEPVLKQFKVTALSDTENEVPEENTRMYVRIVSAKIQQGKMDEFRELYSEEIIPGLKNTRGCRYAFLTESLQDSNEIISVTIWNSKEDAEYYESSGRFAELTRKVKHTLSSFYQWKMALEKKLTGEVKTSDDIKVTHYSMVTGKKFP